MNNEEKKSRFNSIRDLMDQPGWKILVEGIDDILVMLKDSLKDTAFTDLQDIRQIQNEIRHYEKLKKLPEQLAITYETYTAKYNSDPHTEIDAEYEKLLKAPANATFFDKVEEPVQEEEKLPE